MQWINLCNCLLVKYLAIIVVFEQVEQRYLVGVNKIT